MVKINKSESEIFNCSSPRIPGKVYTLDKNDNLQISTKRADNLVVGVCADFVSNVDGVDKIPIVTGGSAKVSVKGRVRKGDEIVSDKVGFAVRANFIERIFKRRSIIGKVLEDNKDNDNKILVLVK